MACAQAFKTLKPTLSDIVPPIRPHTLILLLCQIVSLPDDKTFRYMQLWGPFLFKLPYPYSISSDQDYLRSPYEGKDRPGNDVIIFP